MSDLRGVMELEFHIKKFRVFCNEKINTTMVFYTRFSHEGREMEEHWLLVFSGRTVPFSR